jgi:hypothetical protein
MTQPLGNSVTPGIGNYVTRTPFNLGISMTAHRPTCASTQPGSPPTGGLRLTDRTRTTSVSETPGSTDPDRSRDDGRKR